MEVGTVFRRCVENQDKIHKSMEELINIPALPELFQIDWTNASFRKLFFQVNGIQKLQEFLLESPLPNFIHDTLSLIELIGKTTIDGITELHRNGIIQCIYIVFCKWTTDTKIQKQALEVMYELCNHEAIRCEVVKPRFMDFYCLNEAAIQILQNFPTEKSLVLLSLDAFSVRHNHNMHKKEMYALETCIKSWSEDFHVQQRACIAMFYLGLRNSTNQEYMKGNGLCDLVKQNIIKNHSGVLDSSANLFFGFDSIESIGMWKD